MDATKFQKAKEITSALKSIEYWQVRDLMEEKDEKLDTDWLILKSKITVMFNEFINKKRLELQKQFDEL